MVVDYMDRFVWILGAVRTVSSYVGLTRQVCVCQIHVGEDFFWGGMNHSGASPNAKSFFDSHKFGEGWAVVNQFLIILL